MFRGGAERTHDVHCPQNTSAVCPSRSSQTHAILIECYNPVVDVWEHVELPPNANPRRSFLAACGIE